VTYPWLWRRLPGPWSVRVLLVVAVVVAVFAICAQLVFPQVAERLEDGGGAVNDSAGSASRARDGVELVLRHQLQFETPA
jgi:hypothetical protein